MSTVEFFPFPTAKRAPKIRKKWLELLRREDYDPKFNHRLCSLHFVDGRPTLENPYPTLFSYNNYKMSLIPRSDSAMLKRNSTATKTKKPKRLSEPGMDESSSQSTSMVYTDFDKIVHII